MKVNYYDRTTEDNMKQGFVFLFRSFFSWEWYEDVNVCRVFIHLLGNCNWKPKNWKGIFIDRGQIITSYSHLAKQTNLTLQQVRTALNKLISTNEITIKTTNKYTMITICNFKTYQTQNYENNIQDNQQNNNQITNEQHTNNNQITNEQHTNNNQITTNNNDNNDNKDYNEIEREEGVEEEATTSTTDFNFLKKTIIQNEENLKVVFEPMSKEKLRNMGYTNIADKMELPRTYEYHALQFIVNDLFGDNAFNDINSQIELHDNIGTTYKNYKKTLYKFVKKQFVEHENIGKWKTFNDTRLLCAFFNGNSGFFLSKETYLLLKDTMKELRIGQSMIFKKDNLKHITEELKAKNKYIIIDIAQEELWNELYKQGVEPNDYIKYFNYYERTDKETGLKYYEPDKKAMEFINKHPGKNYKELLDIAIKENHNRYNE